MDGERRHASSSSPVDVCAWFHNPRWRVVSADWWQALLLPRFVRMWVVMNVAQVISAYPDRGLVVAWRDGAVIRRRRLQCREDPRGDAWTDWSAARAEAERVADCRVVIPRLGEVVPS